jgi:uracil-DNA glycosylase
MAFSVARILGEEWSQVLACEFKEDYMNNIAEHLRKWENQFQPQPENIFTAYKLCPLSKVRVVILGQDPYPTPGHAHGLAFSTLGNKLPASLRNIFKEAGIDKPETFSLESWAEQGVFMLNTILTVGNGKPLSHAHLAWHIFTHKTLKHIMELRSPVVYMLWGYNARGYSAELRRNPLHLVLEAPHPSPLSARKGFFGCGHFDKANNFFKLHNEVPVDWYSINQKNSK